MTRISSLASNTSLLLQIFRTRSELFDLETQIGSGKVSQVYSGIASSSERLINQENTRSKLQQYIENNNQMDLRLKVGVTAVQGLRKVVREFRTAMIDGRHVHRAQHAIGNVGRPRNLEKVPPGVD